MNSQNLSRYRSASFSQNTPLLCNPRPFKPLPPTHQKFPATQASSTAQSDFMSLMTNSKNNLERLRQVTSYVSSTSPKSVNPNPNFKKAGERLLELKPIFDSRLESLRDQRNVREALETLRNYQLNVVVDLGEVIRGEEEGERQGGGEYQSKEYVEKINHSKENIKILTNKRKELQGSFSSLKSRMDKPLGRATTELSNLTRPYQSSIHAHYHPTHKSPEPCSHSPAPSSQFQSFLKQQLHTARQTISKLTLINEDLHLKTLQLRKSTNFYKQQAQASRITIKQLNKQITVLREAIGKLEETNCELSKESARKEMKMVLGGEETGRSQVERLVEMERYIGELEKRVQQEIREKGRIGEEVMRERESVRVLEEENQMLRRRAFGDIEELSLERNQSQNSIEKPAAKIVIPRLILTSPPDTGSKQNILVDSDHTQ